MCQKENRGTEIAPRLRCIIDLFSNFGLNGLFFAFAELLNQDEEVPKTTPLMRGTM